jgi:hypothetical protein
LCNLQKNVTVPYAYLLQIPVIVSTFKLFSRQLDSGREQNSEATPRRKLEGETVSMCLDWWSNIHNEPLVCCSIVTGDGLTILAHTEDTSGNSHTATYLKKVAMKAIKS